MKKYLTLTETLTNEFGELVWEHQTEFEGYREDYDNMASLWRKIVMDACDGCEYHLTEKAGKDTSVLTLTFDDGMGNTLERVFCSEEV